MRISPAERTALEIARGRFIVNRNMRVSTLNDWIAKGWIRELFPDDETRSRTYLTRSGVEVACDDTDDDFPSEEFITRLYLLTLQEENNG